MEATQASVIFFESIDSKGIYLMDVGIGQLVQPCERGLAHVLICHPRCRLNKLLEYHGNLRHVLLGIFKHLR